MPARGGREPEPNVDADDDLKDLPAEDAQELKAFLEKRRWFEGKLKVLEELPAIYPFLHPVLIASAAHTHTQAEEPFVRHGEESSNWQLPTGRQVRQWQEQRDKIEEDVLEFDGGDLGRIKQKTRAATLLPLTPPSTHLVSITLDLIVLIDRLLKLLRHRAELLELTSLRWQWDAIRWEVIAETDKIRAEVDSIVKDKARWTPSVKSKVEPRRSVLPQTPASQSSQNGDSPPHKTAAYEPLTPPRTGAPNVSSFNAGMNGAHLSTPEPSHSPPNRSSSSPRFITPKRSLHIPLLHSQLVSARIRQQNLASAQVPRSGALLDRMIDVAGPLKGLGNVDGPSEGSGSGSGQEGAVPDELLDIQDNLEAEVRELGDRVDWCKQLEDHWKLSESHHSASTHAAHAAEQLLEQLRDALDRPCTSEKHGQLASMLEDAQAYLPAPIDAGFPNPSHPSYPENDEHNAQVVADLRDAYRLAEDALRSSRYGVEWYASMVRAREKVLEQRSLVVHSAGRLKTALDRLQYGQGDTRPPDWERPDQLGDEHASWLGYIDAWISEAKEQVATSNGVRQRAILALQQYSNAMRRPSALRDTNLQDPVDDLADEIDGETEALSDTIQQSLKAISLVAQDAPVLRIVDTVKRAENEVAPDISDLEALLLDTTRRSAWPSAPADEEVGKFCTRIDQTRQRIEGISSSISALDDLVKMQQRTLPHLSAHLVSIEARLAKKQVGLDRSADLMRRLATQAVITATIHQEGQGLIQSTNQAEKDMEGLEVEVDGASLDQAFARADALEVEIAAWQATLAERIPFISSSSGASDGAGHVQGPVDPASVLLKPPVSRPSSPFGKGDTIPIDPDDVDRRVRTSINELVLDVNAAMARYQTSCQKLAFDRWARRCHASAEKVDTVLDEWQIYRGQIEAEIDQFDSNALSRPIEDISLRTHAVVEQHRDSLRSAIDDIERIIKEETGRFQSKRSEVDVWRAAAKTARSAVDDALQQSDDLESLLGSLALKVEAQPSTEITADVFGPISTSLPKPTHTVDGEDGAGALDRIRSLRRDLETLEIERLVQPSADDIRQTPTLRRLPNAELATRLTAALEAIRAKADEIAPDDDRAHAEMVDLERSIEFAQGFIPRFGELVRFREAVESCDKLLSQVLEAVDDQKPTLRSVRDDASRAFKAVLSTSDVVTGDRRVQSEVNRVARAWEELQVMVDECLGAQDGPIARAVPTPESASSVRTASRLPRLAGSLPRASASNRAASNPVTNGVGGPVAPSPTLARSVIASQRNRAASDTPARVRPSLRGSTGTGIPRARKESLGMSVHEIRARNVSLGQAIDARTRKPSLGSTPNAVGNAGTWSQSRPSSIPRLAARTVSGVRSDAPAYSRSRSITPSTSRGSHGRRNSHAEPEPEPEKKEYVAVPGHRLDVAVALIVNRLDVNIPVQPVGASDTGTWEDECGQYWIGAEGRAKLCFCRILRSRTVMVRVGGGWVELSKFLLDHFAGTVGSLQTPLGYTAELAEGDTDTDTDTGFGLFSHSHPSVRSIPADATATATATATRRGSLLRSISNSSIASISTIKHLPSLSTSAMGVQAPASTTPTPTPPRLPKSASAQSLSPGSPLMALRFIRKASQSPSVREREKERFHGRRSILGKELE